MLLDEIRHIKKKAVRDAKLTIGVQSKAVIMDDPVHDMRSGRLPENVQDERAHFTTSEVSGVGVDMIRTKHTKVIVHKDR